MSHSVLLVSTEAEFPKTRTTPSFRIRKKGEGIFEVRFEPKGLGTHNIEHQKVRIDDLLALMNALALRLLLEYEETDPEQFPVDGVE